MTKHESSQRKSNRSFRKRLCALRTPLLSDALGKTGAMSHDMKCFSGDCRMAGPAFTLRVHPADILMVAKAISLCPRGSVLVIDGRGDLNTALVGNIVTLEARLKGLEGLVIDGAIRDSAEIRRDHLPVFARAVVPNAGGTEYVGELEVPVQCGGIVVNPGDWVIGDGDGVVVVPAKRLLPALEIAERLAEVEKNIEKAVRGGKALVSILDYDEILRRKAKNAQLPQMRFLNE